MIETEEQLLDLLTRHGFDFSSTGAELARRFPVERDWGHPSFPIVPFRLTHPLVGGVWKIPLNQAVDYELPPLRYVHEFHPTPDARRNHDEAEALLTALLGPGERGSSTNVYERHWKIGFFAIRVITWPKELNRRGHNEFEKRNPYLWLSANIYIEPDFPFIRRTEDATQPLKEVLIEERGEVSIPCESRVYARRNLIAPPQAAAARVAGRNAQDEFVIRSPDRTLRVPIAQIRSVRHTRTTPGRSSGSSRLEFATTFLNRHEVALVVAAGSDTYSLDWTAEFVARALNKSLTVDEYSND